MLITIRVEMHQRFLYDSIPSSDYDIERAEMALVGGKKKWFDLSGIERQLPSGIYITESATVDQCLIALAEVGKRTGRKVTATVSAGSEVHFYNLDACDKPLSGLAALFGSISMVDNLQSSKSTLLTSLLDAPKGDKVLVPSTSIKPTDYMHNLLYKK